MTPSPMTTAAKTTTTTLPAVVERERLREIAAGHQAHRDRLDAEITRAKARLHALHSEIAEAQLAVFNGDTKAEKLVQQLRDERAALRIAYHEERQGNGTVVSGDLMEERETLRKAVRQIAEALRRLHVEHVEEFLINTAPMVAEAEQALTDALDAVKVAKQKWDAARGELNTIGRDAGLGETPAFPVTVSGTTQMRPHHIPAADLADVDVAVFQYQPGGGIETVLVGSPAFEEFERAAAWTRVR